MNKFFIDLFTLKENDLVVLLGLGIQDEHQAATCRLWVTSAQCSACRHLKTEPGKRSGLCSTVNPSQPRTGLVRCQGQERHPRTARFPCSLTKKLRPCGKVSRSSTTPDPLPARNQVLWGLARYGVGLSTCCTEGFSNWEHHRCSPLTSESPLSLLWSLAESRSSAGQRALELATPRRPQTLSCTGVKGASGSVGVERVSPEREAETWAHSQDA